MSASRGRAVNQAACRQRFGCTAAASLGPRGSNDGIVAQLTTVECCDFVAAVNSLGKFISSRVGQWVVFCGLALLVGYFAGVLFGWFVW